jgi:hypothetical protein
MNFKDKSVRDAIDRLKHQYQIFTSNQFIIYYLNEAGIPKNDWIDIEDLIDSNKYYEGEGYDLDRLYEQILTFSRFVVKLKKEILPKINSDAQKRIARLSADNKVLYKMTVDNAPGNVKIFYDIIIDLFIKIKKIDEKRSGEGKMLYDKRSYLKEIEKNLNA